MKSGLADSSILDKSIGELAASFDASRHQHSFGLASFDGKKEEDDDDDDDDDDDNDDDEDVENVEDVEDVEEGG